jgi:hypothetical protein
LIENQFLVDKPFLVSDDDRFLFSFCIDVAGRENIDSAEERGSGSGLHPAQFLSGPCPNDL